jgi:hypothetical protein
MALHVLAYNLTRVLNIIGKPSLIAAIRAARRPELHLKSAIPRHDTHFGRSLDDPTREHRPPAMIGDHGCVLTYLVAHNQKQKSRRLFDLQRRQ